MEYSTAVRQRFGCPQAVAAAATPAVSAEAEDRSLNVWVRVAVTARDGSLDQVVYNAFGCPHMIAACEQVTEWLSGRDIEDLRRVDFDSVARDLQIPREKFGKLLRVEDALIGCANRLEQLCSAKGSE